MINKCNFCGSTNLGQVEHDTVSESDDPESAIEDIYYRKCLDCGELTDNYAD